MREPLSGTVVAWGWIVMILVAVVLVGGRAWMERRRGATLREWAGSHGWTYHGSDLSLAERWDGPPFGVGTSRRVRHAMSGPVGEHEALSFGYAYLTGGGRSKRNHRWHVVALLLPGTSASPSTGPGAAGLRGPAVPEMRIVDGAVLDVARGNPTGASIDAAARRLADVVTTRGA